MWLLHLLLLGVGSWLVLGALFLGYPTMQRLKGHRDELDWKVKVPVYVALVIGILADVIFNAIWGTIIFREPPQEWTFTERLSRHRDNPKAAEWIRQVNLIDPGHV